MAVLRGLESGFSIARATKHGILILTNDRGRILAENSTDSAPFTSLVARIPVRHDSTLYDRFGDWFAWLDLIILATIFLTGFRGAGVANAKLRTNEQTQIDGLFQRDR